MSYPESYQDGLYPSPAHWYALSVKPQHEKQVALALSAKGFDQFLPLYSFRRRWANTVRKVQLPLIPTYTFCHFSLADRLAVVRVPGVRRIVGFGSGPVPILEDEIDLLKAIERSGLPAAPHPFLQTGTQVQIIDGPLRGSHGLLERCKGSDRLIVSVSLLSRSICVDIDQRWVLPLKLPVGNLRHSCPPMVG